MLTATLLALCASTSQADLTACDRFIFETVESVQSARCYADAPANDTRAAVLQALRTTDPKTDARETVVRVLSGECSSSD